MVFKKALLWSFLNSRLDYTHWTKMTYDPWLIATGSGSNQFQQVLREYIGMCHPRTDGNLPDLNHRSCRLPIG